jgi:hypothetical protein
MVKRTGYAFVRKIPSFISIMKGPVNTLMIKELETYSGLKYMETNS